MSNIAQIISKSIMLNNKTQKQVAIELNVSVSTINSYCRGTRQPDLAMLIKLQDNLNIPIETIFNGNIDEQIFKLTNVELDLLGSVKQLNDSNKTLFINYSKEILQLLHSTQKKS